MQAQFAPLAKRSQWHRKRRNKPRKRLLLAKREAMISTPREQCIHTEGVPDSIPASPTILRLLANIPGVACVEATTPRGRSFAMRITYRGTLALAHSVRQRGLDPADEPMRKRPPGAASEET